MSKCPYCQSENVESIKSNTDIYKSYEITQGNCTRSCSGKGFPYITTLCLDCGMVFEKMSDGVLKEYKELKPYFK